MLLTRRTLNVIKENAQIMSAVRHKAAYEGDGRMTIKVLNQEPDAPLMLDAYGTFGFRLNNGLSVLGPLAIFPRTVLSWQVRNSSEITAESLKLFKILVPKIDLLVLGLETKERKVVDQVFQAARSISLNVEILPVENACSTFNFLNSECRPVAGAMIPPLNVQLTENDMLHSKLHYNNLFKENVSF